MPKTNTVEAGERTQHTPGPWEISRTSNGYLVSAQAWGIAAVDGPEDKRLEADARLIAAAPELLDASRKFLAFYNDLAKTNPGFMAKLGLQDYAQWNEAMIELPRAIAKAEGRE